MNQLANAVAVGEMATGLAQALTSEQFAEIVSSYIEKQKLAIRLDFQLAELQASFDKLENSEAKEMSDRDKDRLVTRDISKWLIDLGQYDAATAVFNNFIDKRPQFAREVARLIIARFEKSSPQS